MAFHARSNSLPSRPHPISEQLTEQLCRLRSSQSASTSSSSSLNDLQNLYSCVDEFLQLPHSQQSLSKGLNAILDGTVRLLDISGTSRDVLSQSKDNLQNIQSVLRRRCSGELSITTEATEYLKNRRVVKKTIKKCLKSIKGSNKNDETDASIVAMLKDVESVTVDTLKSFLSNIAGAKIQSQKSGWSAVAKLINGSDKQAVASTSEFDVVDATLESMICQKKKSGINVESLRSQMVTLESEIESFDEALECLFRHLVKTRATLLNIFSQ